MPTQTAARPLPGTTASPRTGGPHGVGGSAVLLPVVVGVLLGPVDLLLQHVLAYPFANLANSPAIWALVAFATGWAVAGRRAWWPAVAGTVTLLLAVEGYYVVAVLALGDDVSTLTDSTAVTWLALGVAAGVVFGTAGSWARAAAGFRGPVGTATAVAVLLAEAWLNLARVSSTTAGRVDAGYRQDAVQTALVLLVLAGVAAVLAGRSARQRVLGLALALPLALAGALAFSTLGFL